MTFRGFLRVFLGFLWVFYGFSRVFCGFSVGFHGFSMGFLWIFMWISWVSKGFSKDFRSLSALLGTNDARARPQAVKVVTWRPGARCKSGRSGGGSQV